MTARCDVCDLRPATHCLIAAGTETWACDECSVWGSLGGPADVELPKAKADEAGAAANARPHPGTTLGPKAGAR
jgi:hypothetical protein